MKKNWSTIVLLVVFVIGLSVMLYPTVSNLVNQRSQSRAIAGYREQVNDLREEEYNTILENAMEYNRNHKANDFSVSDENATTEAYTNALSINGGSLMGYLEIKKTGVRLGIYHGASEAVLQVGIGHLPQTSLPVGGESTHAVVSGHTGLPSAELLSDLDTIEIGDRFRFYILNEVYEYEVDQILVVLPDELDELKIVEGMDYATIVTCTPYGVNSHRLLVRGHAVEYSGNAAGATGDAVTVEPLIVATIIAVPILLVSLTVILVRYKKGKKSA